jgi:predicted homoserine dehydrogenase-like protein
MIAQRLKQLEAHGDPILVGATAEGWMGSGFVAQMAHVPGMRLMIVADEDVEAAWKAYQDAGIGIDDIVEAGSPGKAADAIRSGKRVVTGDYSLASKINDIDIITDVTPSPEIGAQTAFAGITNGKDVVLINIEADVTVGRILKKMAQEAGVLYSVSSGDEPGCMMELYDFVTALGLEVIVIGKGKNNPLNPQATPEDVADAAQKADKDPFQVASYVDGTKTMFEMTCAANATGCRPMRRGMNGPEATLETVSELFALKEDGGISAFSGAVDFVQGSSMAGGVFVTVHVEDERIRDDLQYLKVGQGHYFTFFRPYHLWFIEAPISIARAYFDRQVTLSPLDTPVAEVAAVAKRGLKPGDVLDRFGGYTFYGLIDQEEAYRKVKALPAGLAPGARIINPVPEDQVISWDDVELDETKTVVKLRRQQNLL